MNITDLISKAVDLGTNVTGSTIKFIVGNPVASRVAAGMLLHKGATKVLTELTGKQSEKRGVGQYISGGMDIVLGGVLAIWNDPSWYENVPITSHASIDYVARKDANMSFTRQDNIHVLMYIDDLHVPHDKSRLFENQILTLYQSVAGFNNRSTTIYDIGHFRAYITNMRGIAALYSQLVRLYGFINLYNVMDTAIPRALFKSYGYSELDYKFVLSEQANLCTRIKNIALKLSSQFPMMGDYINRTTMLMSNMYMDDDQAKAVCIGIRSRYITFAKYNYVSSKFEYDQIDTSFLPSNNPNDPRTIDTIVSQLETLCADTMSFPNFTVFVSDIRRSYGDRAFPIIDVPDFSYSTGIVYNTEILALTENICSARFGKSISIDDGIPYRKTSSNDQILLTSTGTYLGTGSSSPTITISTSNYTNNIEIGSDSTRDIVTPFVVNAENLQENIVNQITITRFSNNFDYKLKASKTQYSSSSIGDNIGITIDGTGYARQVGVQLAMEPMFRGGDRQITQSGDDIIGVDIIYTDQLNGDLNIGIIHSQKYGFLQNILTTYDADPKDNYKYVIQDRQLACNRYIHAWANVDWMPRAVLLNFDIYTNSNTTVATDFKIAFGESELFDEKLFGIYYPVTKEEFDAVAINSLYAMDLIVRSYVKTNFTQELDRKHSKNRKKDKDEESSKDSK